MQLVDPSHERQIGLARGRRLVVDRAATDPQFSGLRRERKGVRPVEHRFALGNRPPLPSAFSR